MNKNRPKILQQMKETPEVRRKRASSGVKVRASVFANKKKKLLDKYAQAEDDWR